MYECETCDRQFGSNGARAQHMNALDHWAESWECEECGEEFDDEDEYEEHLDDYDHWPPKHECEACEEKFYTPQQARVHMDDYGHWRNHWCAVCERGFQNDNNLQIHNRSNAHLAHFPHACEACNLRYTTFPGVRKHMDEENHWRTHWCAPCKRGFQNDNNLQQHFHGAAHMKDSISCPFCKRGFTTASGVAHHLETGSCPSATNLNRETIHRIVSARDTSGAITSKLLTYKSSANATYTATNASWNGEAFECYLCHRDFGSLRSLDQHLNSAVHKQKLYHCFGRECGKEFVALAGLFNHLESESCGAVRFGDVQRGATGVLMGRGRIGF